MCQSEQIFIHIEIASIFFNDLQSSNEYTITIEEWATSNEVSQSSNHLVIAKSIANTYMLMLNQTGKKEIEKRGTIL